MLLPISHIEVMSGLTGQKIIIKDAGNVMKVMDDIKSLKYEKKGAVEWRVLVKQLN